jgi:predicted nucleic acid-binding protein
VKLIADTGFLVAAMNRHDRHHSWAIELAGQITEPLLTCESVLSETAFHLGSSEIPLRMIRQKFVRVDFDLAAELSRLEELAVRYKDRKPDLADLCLIRLSETHPRHSVLTIDVSDFRVYRRNQREVIPLIHPPGM